MMERAAALCKGSIIGLDDLPATLHRLASANAPPAIAPIAPRPLQDPPAGSTSLATSKALVESGVIVER